MKRFLKVFGGGKGNNGRRKVSKVSGQLTGWVRQLQEGAALMREEAAASIDQAVDLVIEAGALQSEAAQAERMAESFRHHIPDFPQAENDK